MLAGDVPELSPILDELDPRELPEPPAAAEAGAMALDASAAGPASEPAIDGIDTEAEAAVDCPTESPGPPVSLPEADAPGAQILPFRNAPRIDDRRILKRVGAALLAALALGWAGLSLFGSRPGPDPRVAGFLDRTANVRSVPRSDLPGTILTVLPRGQKIEGQPDRDHPDWLKLVLPHGENGYVKRSFAIPRQPPLIDAGAAGWRIVRTGAVHYPDPAVDPARGTTVSSNQRAYVTGTTSSGLVEIIVARQIRYLAAADLL